MNEPEASALDYLAEAKEIVWDALESLERAQLVLFRAGDLYVGEVWGDGVRAVIDVTERITSVAGDLTRVPIEIERIAHRDRDRRA